jgi:hypothetical protein
VADPIAWESRFYDMANEPHHWTEWERLKPKFHGHECVQEMRDYIAAGYRYQMRPIYAGPAHGYGVQATGEAERIAELEAEVAHVRRWYGDRLEILSAWAREHLTGEQLHTFFNIAANARPHHTDEPEWFRAVIARLAARGVKGPQHG